MDLDFNQLLQRFSRSVVRIEVNRIFNRDADDPDKMIVRLEIVIPGVVTTSGSDFCHIIACCRGFFFAKPDDYIYEVFFQDGTAVVLDIASVEVNNRLAAFFLRTAGKKADAVQFNDQNAAPGEKVWMFGYNHSSLSLLDDGTVTHLGDDCFGHDCPPNSLSSFGYPVFNLETKLVGISYYHHGVTYAIDVQEMIETLSSFFDGMVDKPLLEIIHHIEVLGEDEHRELQD